MGIVNLTPDSFSDGGQFRDHNHAIQYCFDLFESGAHVVDLGPESTRPGAQSVATDVQWARLESVLAGLRQRNFPGKISIDCRDAVVCKRSLQFRPDFINNVDGLFAAETMEVIAKEPGTAYIAMHKEGTPETMQTRPLNAQSASANVRAFFETCYESLKALGFSDQRIWLDPGIGFGKSDAGNWMLLRTLPEWRSRNILIGVSRKGFIGRALDIASPIDRDAPTKMLEISAIFLGAKMIRTHDVRGLKKALQIAMSENA